MKNNTIKELPVDERPYEKCIKYGPKVLSDSELLAIILKTGTASNSVLDISRKVLTRADGNLSLLSIYDKSFEELKAISGIGSVKAITLKCIAEISERLSKSTNNGLKFETPKQVADYYMEELRHLKTEQFRVLFLNNSNIRIADRVISNGTVNTSLVSPREVFEQALRMDAVKIILMHNHPSGDPTPSVNDIEITRKISEAGSVLDIKVLDHIVFGDNKYISLRELDIKEG